MAPSVESTMSWSAQVGNVADLHSKDGLRVAIIGAGVSGLTTCKHMLEQGLNPTVFEMKNGLGGVWRSSYSSTRLQTPKQSYQFTDFPWPDHVPQFPSHHDVVEYLEGYANKFGLYENIQFDSKLLSVVRVAKNSGFERGEWTGRKQTEVEGLKAVVDVCDVRGISSWNAGRRQEEEEGEESVDDDFVWEICVRRSFSASDGFADYIDECHEFDYLVMCCGRFGDVPRVPSFPLSQGPDVFEGQVLHALEYSALDSQGAHDFVAGKKVIVVGFQKTSLDIAVEIAEANQGMDSPPCTMVFRRTHWMYPRHRQAFGVIPFAFFWSTRLSGFFTPKPGQGLARRLLQSFFNPLRLGLWRMIEFYLRLTLPLSRFGLIPEHSLVDDLTSCVLPQVPIPLFRHLEAGRILTKKSPYLSFYSKGLRLADGTSIEADAVILCTGYNGEAKLKSMLPKMYRDVLFEPENVLTLYRGIIHPQIPNMGFIGFFEGLSSVHSSELGAAWLARLLRKKFTLPPVADMETDRWEWLQHFKTVTPFFNRPCVAPLQIWQSDKLCQDMGMKHLRKKSWWQEMFSLYGNSDYDLSQSSQAQFSSLKCRKQ